MGPQVGNIRLSVGLTDPCVQVVTLVKSGDNWLLQVAEGQYLYFSTTKNTINTGNKTDASAQWIISIVEGVTYIKNAGVTDVEWFLHYNQGSSRFCTYKASSNQAAPKLYLVKTAPVVVETLVSPAKSLKWEAETAVEGSEIFSFTNKVKTESIKIEGATVPGIEINSQFSLTAGKVQLNTEEETPEFQNGIKLVLTEDVTITVYAAVKSDKLDKNITVTLLDTTGATVAGSSTALTADSVTPVEIDLTAGTYYLGGTSGGLYVYAIVVSK